jgi:molybdopterin converting factor subunit 1
VRILFFAQLREVTGLDQAEIQVDRVDASSLWNSLLSMWPGLASHRANVRMARNGAYAEAGEIFCAGDEVALIPPVSGG